MIYFDNSATTFPKPQAVYWAVNNSLKQYGANPGRSGHSLSMASANQVYKSREKVAKFFNAPNIENIIFTPGCTYSLNMVIKGLLKSGDHVVISNLEHNSVLRPLQQMTDKGVTYTVAETVYGDFDKTIDNFRRAINNKTKLFAVTHASNVTGTVLPISRLSALAHQYNIKILIDCAQSAGVLPIDVDKYNVDYMATAGHKGLMGIMGLGVLYIKDIDTIEPLICGGTGSSSLEATQPAFAPDKFESGTCNLSGICALEKGIDFINKISLKHIYNHEFALLQYLYNQLEKLEGVIIYNHKPQINYTVPVLSFNIQQLSSEKVAEILDKKYNIAVRAGLHCSPLAHNTLKTTDQGTVRISLSYFNNKQEINALINGIKNILTNYKK